MLKHLREFNFIWLAIYAISYLIMILLKTYRWKVLLKTQGINYDFKKVLNINVSSNFWGAITPGRIGELIKLDYLQRDNYSIHIGAANVLIDRSIDVVLIVIFSFVSLVYFADAFFDEIKIVLLLLLTLVVIVGLLFLLRGHIKISIKKIIEKMLPEEQFHSVEHHWNEFLRELQKFNLTVYCKMLLLSVGIYLLIFLMTYTVAEGLGLQVPFIYLSLSTALSTLVALLPISIGGIGTREALFIFLLGNISISNEAALLIAFFDGTVLGIFFAALMLLMNNFFRSVK